VQIYFLTVLLLSIFAGTPWNQLREAVRLFLTRRIEDSADDVVSIINFASSARMLCDRMPIQDCRRSLDTLLTMEKGSTNFSEALKMAREVLRGQEMQSSFCCESSKHPILLFMSDGLDTDSESAGVPEMQVWTKSRALFRYS
jgi:Mg-chelatase subunit ChlD